MFDIGFSEIVVIAVVALVVLGPEKLPKTARTLGHLFGRLQRYVNDVKSDIKREMELDELKKLQESVQSAAKEIETSMSAATRDVEAQAREVESAFSATAPAPASGPPAATAPPAASAALPPLTEPPAEPPKASEPPRQGSLPGFDRG